jgi:imidazolonepropionase-like amidohydrolase
MKLKSFRLLFALLVSTAMLSAQPKITIIKAGKLIDVVAGIVLKDQRILIENGTIKQIGENIAIPNDAEIIDLSASIVLPGLIDCHTHLSGEGSDDYYSDIFRKSAIDCAVVAHIYTKRTLQAGFTTCRDVGSSDLIDISLRNAINEGVIEGPRMLVACFPIGATGGHVDFSGFNPNIDWKGNKDFTGVADGVEEIRKRVRNNVKWGADVIKFCATGGVLSEEETLGPQYSFEEMKAVVDEAHMWGKQVAAHAHSTEGIKLAVLAGANSIEHCTILDDATIKLMKEKGTYMVPTLYVQDYVVANFKRKGFPEKIINKAKNISKQKEAGIIKAIKAGVKIAYGTDATVIPHGLNAKDFAYLVKAGMTPMQAIQTATVNAADLLKMGDKIGTISVGKFADIIGVKVNPLDDITALESVSFVMKNGEVYKNDIAK